MRYRAILFDLDGTTLDTDLYVVLNYVHMFKKFCPEHTPHLAELVTFSGPTLESVFAEHFKGYSFEELLAEFSTFSKSYSNSFSSLYPGELDCLKKLKAGGAYLGIVTSKRRFATDSNLKHFGLDCLMDISVCLDEVARPKPYPDSILQALRALDVDASEALYIGDSYSDYLAGEAAGTATGLVTWGLKRIQDEADPDYFFSSFKEIEEALLNE